MQDCIFCRIVSGELPASVVYEDELVVVFKDIKPVAPVHLLIIPKKHVESLWALQDEDALLAGHIQLVAGRVARQMGLEDGGFRLVCNCGRDAGQVVWHIHYHLLAGRPMQWPPG